MGAGHDCQLALLCKPCGKHQAGVQWIGADRPLLFQGVTDEEPWPALPLLDWKPQGQSLGSDHSLPGTQLPTAHREMGQNRTQKAVSPFSGNLVLPLHSERKQAAPLSNLLLSSGIIRAVWLPSRMPWVKISHPP